MNLFNKNITVKVSARNLRSLADLIKGNTLELGDTLEVLTNGKRRVIFKINKVGRT